MLRPILMRLSRRPWRLLLPIVLVVVFTLALSRSASPRRPPQQQSPYYQKKTKSHFPPLRRPGIDPDYCENFPTSKLDDIQVVLKTGAGERNKTRAHLSTVSSCIQNLIIVSDHEDDIRDHHVIDILAELPLSYAENNSDFQSYLDHKKAHGEGDKVDYSQGWKLDRFKFLPMVDKAYEINPKAKWYVFLESDIYILWDTLFRLLEQYDENDMHYLGAPPPASKSKDSHFAYGGAGFVLSQGLVRALHPPTSAAVNPEVVPLAHRFQEQVKNDCCGDSALAYAIKNMTETRMEALAPTFSGVGLKKIKITKDRWCVPLLSLHHVDPEEMEKLWRWERTRPFNTKPFVYSNLLAYTHPHLKQNAVLEWWDNLSEAPVPNDRPAHRNAGSCGSECANDANCLQWSYSQTVCRFANFIKIGNPVDKNNGGQGDFTSGWELGKMAQLGFKTDEASDIHDTCEDATWLTPQVPPVR